MHQIDFPSLRSVKPDRLLAFIAVLLVLLLPACSEELSVEQQIIATLRNMEYSAEQGEHFDFMGYVADDFSARDGMMDRRAFHRFMILQLNENRRMQAQFFPIFVEEEGEGLASARFQILVTGGAGLVPDRGQLFTVETSWLQEDGDWLLESADWSPVRLPELQKIN